MPSADCYKNAFYIANIATGGFMKIIRSGAIPSMKGPEDWFTGTVRIDSMFSAEAPGRMSTAHVTFELGARTAWHTHPAGQTLIITFGSGWVQREHGPVEVVNQGDIVWFPAGEKHWHGAGAETAMSHIAIQESMDGSPVTWMEKVTDTDYSS
jgi:quercetin dioxygenase-like cupin family protein